MNAPFPAQTRETDPAALYLASDALAAFADTLAPDDAMYWPALAAADGCDASLAELNAMLIECDCYPFDARSVFGMGGGL